MTTLSPQKKRLSPFPSLICPAKIVSQSQFSHNTRVILVRHGRSTYNDRGIYQGSSDESVLTEKGQKDAYKTGIALQSIDIDCIYTSPLQRAQQTAREILNARKQSVQGLPRLLITDKLKEIHIAPWQGLSYQYVQENFPQEYYYWKNFPHQFKLVDREKKQETIPVIDLYQQAEQFWQEILPQHQGKTILVVSHGGTNRALINTALGIEPANYNFLQQSNCGISILEFSQEENWRSRLKALNLTGHLGKTLPKLKEGKQGLRLLLVASDICISQLQQLAEFWQQESIDFIFSNSWKSSYLFMQNFCLNQSKFFYLQVAESNILKVSQQQILSGKIFHSLATEKKLVTGLAIFDRANLNQILAEISGSYAQAFTDNCLNIIHYPDLDRHPIFQEIAINVAHSE
ncbi:MAG: histidine phosphatase family protein [Xenococcaceae cyanobacterium MO_188.B29]|nr:histidine phosphatase family protein [Xenococcaceae cyanobacterium MO_188.B29]